MTAESPGTGSLDRVPLGPPEITDADIGAVVDVLRTTQLSRGPAEARFEQRIAAYVGTRHAIAVNSGTSGLHLCVRALGLQAGDEVITTPYSFVASANALLYEGVVPVFVDVNEAGLDIDATAIEAAITPRTRAILPVHVYGWPAAMPALCEIAKRRGVALIEDACEALGSEIGGRRAGAWGDAGVLSFYPNKQITTGEGGVVVTDDAGLAARMRLLRNQGRAVAAADGFDQVELGFSYRLPEMSCALGVSQLSRMEAVVTRRAQIAAAYQMGLADCEALRLPAAPAAGTVVSWFVYVVRLSERYSAADRDRIVDRMRAQGIECGRYFAPIHLQPLYRRRFGYRGGEFPVSEAAGARVIALPFFNRISEAQIARVCDTLRRTLTTAC